MPQCRATEVLRAHGADDYIGEPISQVEHALQCAALAQRAGSSDAMIAAALFHDIGHLCATDKDEVMPGLGVVRHEHIGAEFLARAGYPDQVCELVRGHVEAKRYLVATNARYAERLSDASQGTLALQGGPLDDIEVATFRADPLKREKLQLRVWDEQAKDPGARVPDLEHYAPMLARLRAQAPERATRDEGEPGR